MKCLRKFLSRARGQQLGIAAELKVDAAPIVWCCPGIIPGVNGGNENSFLQQRKKGITRHQWRTVTTSEEES
jgi:hypothetical protein